MLDTNVLVSAFIFKGQTISKMVDILTDNHSLVLSSYVLDELKEVIKDKFPTKYVELDIFLTNLPFEYIYTPDILDNTKYPVLRDSDDLPVLVSSIMADVDILLTGDKDFSGLALDRPKILTPAQFVEQYQPR
ncbi:MAG: putative toxin-antitoxin system toxin component, PIN family [Deltaproteobacteria bacterium]|jgi:putative PIN family toxin of toxin-antitoxin system|nr:putative toxin-antitoxin system toxin component, PIN family [Deltaproteobacteria bacterium]